MSTLNHAVIEFLQQSNISPLKAVPLKHSFVCTLENSHWLFFYCWPCFVMILTSVEAGGVEEVEVEVEVEGRHRM